MFSSAIVRLDFVKSPRAGSCIPPRETYDLGATSRPRCVRLRAPRAPLFVAGSPRWRTYCPRSRPCVPRRHGYGRPQRQCRDDHARQGAARPCSRCWSPGRRFRMWSPSSTPRRARRWRVSSHSPPQPRVSRGGPQAARGRATDRSPVVFAHALCAHRTCDEPPTNLIFRSARPPSARQRNLGQLLAMSRGSIPDWRCVGLKAGLRP